jgi:flavin reductase (DIM6/NTAB) family NADH-FMN oxidoreductase RutF
VDTALKRQALRKLSSGVYVLTSRSGDRYGAATITWVSQASFFPTAAVDGTLNGEPYLEGVTSAPVLVNLPAYLECRVEQIIDTDGDHAVVILRVVEAQCRQLFRPLVISDSPWEYGG